MKKKIDFLLVARLLAIIGCILMVSVFFIPFSSAISLLTGDYKKYTEMHILSFLAEQSKAKTYPMIP